jgi:HlyD family type I secretion membrane fusion protein
MSGNVMGQSTKQVLAKPPVNPRSSILLGIVVILVMFGGFGTWASMASISSAVVAPGYVTVDSNRKKIQHLEGGVVRELLVREGDEIEAGEVLIRLDEIRPQATLSILRARYYSARATEARLLAEQQGSKSIHFPEQLMLQLGDKKIAEIMATQDRLLEARRNSIEGETEILKNRIVQLQDDVKGIQAQQSAKERQISLIKEELDSVRGLLDKGYTDRPRYLALQREMARLEGERGELISEIARTKTRIGETQLEMIQLKKAFREQVVTELRNIGADISDLEEQIGAARHTLEHIEIRAPVDGVVIGMEVHTVGGVIRAGDTILEIVPVNDQLIIEVRIQPQDIDNISLGLQADVQFTAFKQRTTPKSQGEVTYLSADRFVDGHTGEAYYLARIRVSEEEVKRLGDHQLQPGMPAEIMIKTGERTAFQYLVQPFMDSLDKAWREE